MAENICIESIASISPLGITKEDICSNYQKTTHLLKEVSFGDTKAWVSSLSESAKLEVNTIRNSNSRYQNLDDSVLYGIYAARKAVEHAGWGEKENFGINMGSSRGATGLFEKYHSDFLNNNTAAVLTSPTTTLGNISSWIADDLKSKGPTISHSITCSTALHALLNGMAWIKSGMTDKFLIGGSEAPLTPFTIAQMKALKIYASKSNSAYPCRALDLEKQENSMVLGEGAGAACLTKGITEDSLAILEGVGFATEPLKHNISLSANAQCLQESMLMALKNLAPGEVDVIVMHAPGTVKGDVAEYTAIETIFGNSMPALTTNKWKVGHTFGASGILSLEMAILMLKKQNFLGTPFKEYDSPAQINRVLINAVGFGGNAVSVLLKTPKT
ncbi:beta-ketoacyl synthase N-terminal-like domain-containing protein [uncultured Eudoraea sp.]|uniref:beta-ketoacyl synthase N-terminal-like domain-containing protein n=1 Tax=uncultured Eudoraea sp. TaxID=1035614 RepID=UPI00260E095E|nr:beta-ketoacyl synthase N-terminal-like domain-containing protein [uncultured Eudoraea sp.]